MNDTAEATSLVEEFGVAAYGTLRMSVPWFLVWLLGSFALFHCYLNIVAEFTLFADRLWYRDFWNATDFSGECLVVWFGSLECKVFDME